eukprot:scaffold11486_cov103-Isochrysis_galbana.AAC.2
MAVTKPRAQAGELQSGPLAQPHSKVEKAAVLLSRPRPQSPPPGIATRQTRPQKASLSEARASAPPKSIVELDRATVISGTPWYSPTWGESGRAGRQVAADASSPTAAAPARKSGLEDTGGGAAGAPATSRGVRGESHLREGEQAGAPAGARPPNGIVGSRACARAAEDSPAGCRSDATPAIILVPAPQAWPISNPAPAPTEPRQTAGAPEGYQGEGRRLAARTGVYRRGAYFSRHDRRRTCPGQGVRIGGQEVGLGVPEMEGSAVGFASGAVVNGSETWRAEVREQRGCGGHQVQVGRQPTLLARRAAMLR